MTKMSGSLYGYSIDSIEQKINDMIALGYSKQEVITITCLFPCIIGLSIKNIKQRINDIMDLGYSKQDVIEMTKSLPQIYGYSIEAIREKKIFYDSIGLYDLFVIDTKQMMQSNRLSYARYMFYKSIGIIITMNNYKKLFMGQSRFEKQYGITKQQLLEMYPYEEYCERIEHGRII